MVPILTKLNLGRSELLRPIPVLALTISLALGIVRPAQAASYLSIRQTILTQQRDRVLIGFVARIGPIGEVHGISDDCDVHIPLITAALFLPVLGEVKNACSKGPTRAQLVALGPGPMRVEGAFRIWFEGHDDGIPFREEEGKIPEAYTNSGPSHLLEVHPITRLGDLDLLDHVQFIEKGGKTIGWKTVASFRTSARTQLTVRRQTFGNKRYILLSCRCAALANHYALDAQIEFVPHKTDNADGVVATARILDEVGATLRPATRLFAIRGTPAFDVLKAVRLNDKLTVYALARLSLRPLLALATANEKIMDMPIELVVLHAKRQ